MAVTIVEEARPTTCRTAITGGVDTHADTHVAAALDPVGGLLGVREFPATPAGYAGLLGWLGGFGTVALVGIGRPRISQAKRGGSTGLPDRSRRVNCGNDEDGQPELSRRPGTGLRQPPHYA